VVQTGLRRTLSLFDATAIGIGAIIGAGIFVVLGIAIGYAGPAAIISIIMAGVVASFTALSFAEVGSAIPKEGGVYEYAYEMVSPFVGFIVGCLWLFAQIVAGTALSLGFGSYFVSLFPYLSPKLVAVLAASALTVLNLVGIKQSAFVNNALVVTKVAILLLFIVFGIPLINARNYSPFAPAGFSGVLQGTAFIFFAYAGFGRVATLGEEVKNPTRTLPLSILLALVTSVIIYALASLVATGLVNYTVLAGSGSPIADAARVTGNFAVVATVSLGALIATASVILTNLIGLSRVSFAMARNAQLPGPIARVHSRFGTPYVSVLGGGLLMIALVVLLNLTQTIAITSFSVLSLHVVVNYSAIRVRKNIPNLRTFKTPAYPLIPLFGLVSCIVLMFSLPVLSWMVTLLVSIAASMCFLIMRYLQHPRGN
jgi:APA family basic amino acid/polyamine antiporter